MQVPQNQKQFIQKKANWDIALEKVPSQNSELQEEMMNNLKKHYNIYKKNIEVQVGQITHQISQQVQGNPSSNTISNPKNNESVNVVTNINQK